MKLIALFPVKKLTCILLSGLIGVQNAGSRFMDISVTDPGNETGPIDIDISGIDFGYWDKIRNEIPARKPFPVIETETKLMPYIPPVADQSYDLSKTAEDFGTAFVPELSDKLISTEVMLAYNASKNGLNLDILTEKGFNDWIETGELSPKDIGIIGERTVAEAVYNRAVSELEHARSLLTYAQNNPKFYHPEQIQYYKRVVAAAEKRVAEAGSNLKPIQSKWSATQLRGYLSILNLLLAGYVIYSEGKNMRALNDELEYDGRNANLIDQIARRYISATSLTSAILTTIKTFFPTAAGIKGAAGAAALTKGAIVGSIAQAGLLALMFVGAIYLTTTEEWKIHTQDSTWENMSQIDWGTFWLVPGGLLCWPLWFEAYYRYKKGSIAMEMMVQPFQNLKTTWNEGKDWIMGKTSERAKPPEGVGALKPNIYLYSEEETDAKLTFGVPQWLRVSDPVYEGAWNVRVMDGRLRMEDGEECGYLFYESETQPFCFQKENGWRISAETRAEQFRRILESYGFNETEIRDFLEFWVERLEAGEDYMMYPQLTDTVDAAMPLEVEPACDHVFRLWFTFEKASGKADVKEPEPVCIDRSGFALVEWGGVILDE